MKTNPQYTFEELHSLGMDAMLFGYRAKEAGLSMEEAAAEYLKRAVYGKKN